MCNTLQRLTIDTNEINDALQAPASILLLGAQREATPGEDLAVTLASKPLRWKARGRWLPSSGSRDD